tara:strand:- start:41 stop:511 length:471 start_codon:yes stop_codon:yes gene_type:complete
MTDINTRGYPNPKDPNDPTHGKGLGPKDPYTERITDLFPAKCYSNYVKKNDPQNPQQERHYWKLNEEERYSLDCRKHVGDYMEDEKVTDHGLMLKKNVMKFEPLPSTGGRRRRRKSRKSKTFRKKQKKRKTRRKSRKSKKRKSRKSKKRRTRRRRK